jgi:hypothetical protein
VVHAVRRHIVHDDASVDVAHQMYRDLAADEE